MKSILSIIFLCFLCGCSSKHDGKYVAVYDTDFHIKELGHGTPAVLFENGMASGMQTWQSIPDSASAFTQVFLYDRAGTGQSDTTSRKRTIPNMVNELRTILKTEKINPPYIYVAHSMGSYLARYYAIHYPDEIKALILIDPSPDKLYDDYSEKEYEEFQKIGDDNFFNASEGEQREWQNYLENRKYIRDDSIPENIPMIIISATEWDFYDYHSDIMNNNPESKHFEWTGGHNIHQEKPEEIVALIKTMLGL